MTNRLMNSGVKTTAFSGNNAYMSLPPQLPQDMIKGSF